MPPQGYSVSMARTRKVPPPVVKKQGRKKHSPQDDLFKRQVGTRLREIRNHWKYTQKEFSQILGIPHGTYNKYEIGESFPHPATIAQLIVWGVNMNYLLAGFGDRFIRHHVMRPGQIEYPIN